jgi:hypothetical protein
MVIYVTSDVQLPCCLGLFISAARDFHPLGIDETAA